MKFQIYKLLINSSILSLPGIFSIIFSLISIPLHLKIAGIENYGNYIIFHFLLIIASIFNLGIGKSITISINNYPKKSKEIGFQGLKYTLITILILTLFVTILFKFNILEFITKLIDKNLIYYLFFGISLSVIYSTLEGIFQGNEKFKLLSFFNFIFFSLSLTFPSIILIIDSSLLLKEIIFYSIFIKFLAIILMFIIIHKQKLITKSNNKILLTNLKQNAKWLTLNSILIHFYDLFDKYLIKIFLGPVSTAIYTVPQQLTGKLSILSKGFSAYLLANLARNNDNSEFNFSLKIFLKILPIIIFFLFPFYEYLLNIWLGNQYNQKILILTKIFSLTAIFSCTSHLLITKFEASKTLNQNLKIEFMIMPFFLILLYSLTSNKFSLFEISLLILAKEIILLVLRLNILKKKIKNVIDYYLHIIFFLLIFYLSINYENLFLVFLILITLSNLIKND